MIKKRRIVYIHVCMYFYCMCICIVLCVYIYMHIYACMCLYIYICMYVYICACLLTCIWVYVYIYIIYLIFSLYYHLQKLLLLFYKIIISYNFFSFYCLFLKSQISFCIINLLFFNVNIHKKIMCGYVCIGTCAYIHTCVYCM